MPTPNRTPPAVADTLTIIRSTASASPTQFPTAIPTTSDTERAVGVELSDSGASRIDTIFRKSSVLVGALVALVVVFSNIPGEYPGW